MAETTNTEKAPIEKPEVKAALKAADTPREEEAIKSAADVNALPVETYPEDAKPNPLPLEITPEDAEPEKDLPLEPTPEGDAKLKKDAEQEIEANAARTPETAKISKSTSDEDIASIAGDLGVSIPEGLTKAAQVSLLKSHQKIKQAAQRADGTESKPELLQPDTHAPEEDPTLDPITREPIKKITVEAAQTYEQFARANEVGDWRELASFNGVRNGIYQLNPGDVVQIPTPHIPKLEGDGDRDILNGRSGAERKADKEQ